MTNIPGESSARALQHLLMARELIGESRRVAFETAARRYQALNLEHMRPEETVNLPAAFETNCDPLTGQYPRDPAYDWLFTRIVNRTPAPLGLGDDA